MRNVKTSAQRENRKPQKQGLEISNTMCIFYLIFLPEGWASQDWIRFGVKKA
jgi:hypothetical protein